jgi:hypothetical protein
MAAPLLWIEEAKQLFFFMLTERSAHAHVTHNRAGDSRRESIRRSVAARAVLLKYSFAFILLNSLLSYRVFEWLGSWRAALLCGNSQC